MNAERFRMIGAAAAAIAIVGSLSLAAYPRRERPDLQSGIRPDAAVVPSHFAEMQRPTSFQGTPPTAWGNEARTIDGHGNNLTNPHWGRVATNLIRIAPADYADGVSQPSGGDRPSPREISNIVASQVGNIPNPRGATDFLWQWGQFLDHDLDLTPIPDKDGEEFPIAVPIGDPLFDPMATGTQEIPLTRSAFDPDSGTGPENPREQFNLLTAFIDASNVYGSDVERADWLRTKDGTGRLKISAGNLLPYNTAGLPNAGGLSPRLFLAGDVRTNEQIALATMHTLFVREHNRLADLILATEPHLDDEEVYQRARAIVGAQMQVITYKEFLPILLGSDAISPYMGYKPDVDPSISTEFASAGFRLGHTMLSPTILRRAADGSTIPGGDLPLKDAFFFPPNRLIDEGGIAPILRGLASQPMQRIDAFVVEDVRSFLFGPPGSGGLDLVALNLQRAREHGLAGYNETRKAYGLSPATTFTDICSVPAVAANLQQAFGDMGKVDLWIAAIAEDPVGDGMVGETLRTILVDQFERVRDGDRFWYQNYFSGPLLAELEATRLSDVIRRNTEIGDELQDNVFLLSQGEIPAVSTWGLISFALLLLIAGTETLRRTSLTGSLAIPRHAPRR